MSGGTDSNQRTLGLADLCFNEQGLVPAVVRDRRTGEVLMLAWQNKQALELTLAERVAWFWSRSRQELWKKGATSGVLLRVCDVRVDCDGDALLLDVEAEGDACHLQRRSCFSDRLVEDGAAQRPYFSIGVLEAHLRARIDAGGEHSYTKRLVEGPEDELYRKIGEEATEVLLAAKGESTQQLLLESADLTYHLLVTLLRRGLSWSQLQDELQRRVRP